MSNNIKNIAILIADIEEYKHVEATLGDCARRDDFHGLLSHTVELEIKSGVISLRTICFGIGKVNAALAAAFVTDGFDLIVNTGLSGGFDGVKKYDLIVGTSFVEHDFDLTPIGYKRGQKPNEEIFSSVDTAFNIQPAGSFRRNVNSQRNAYSQTTTLTQFPGKDLSFGVKAPVRQEVIR
jgi:nucleoside phosphorylase